MLEILNFVVIGLLMVPAHSLPEVIRVAYLCIPYVAPAHLAKIATSLDMPILFGEALTISIIEALTMSIIALYTIKSSEKWIKKNGVRAIGFW